MRKSPKQAVDGFVPRASGRTIGQVHEASPQHIGQPGKRPELNAEATRPSISSKPLPAVAPVSRKDIDESLRNIDDTDEPVKKRRRLFRRKPKAPPSRRKRIIKRIVKILLIIALIVGAWLGIRAFIAASSIFQGNIFDFFQSKPLKVDENGRSNILIFGTSGSVDDQRHEGAQLTDTLMVLSIDQKKKNAYMVSLPRDLYVQYGAACTAGYEGKINAMYECFSDGGTNVSAGAKALQRKAKEVTGLTMQYYAHVNWAVVVKAINAVGGVTVDVQGNGSCAAYGMPEGSIIDHNMKIRLTPGKHKMKGEEALRFSRARGSAGGCGLDQGDFDRQANQQKVISALRTEAVSAGTLANVGKVTGLIDALGENLVTDFEMAEVRTLMSLAGDIPSDKIRPINLVDPDAPLLTTGNIGGQSIVQPLAGVHDYSQIIAHIKKQLVMGEVVREKAKVAVLNGSRATGFAQTKADELKAEGFRIGKIDNAPEGTYQPVELYTLSSEKPATKAMLEKKLGVTAKSGGSKFSLPKGTHFVVVYGPTSGAR